MPEFTGAPSIPAAAQGGPSDPGGQFRGDFAPDTPAPQGGEGPQGGPSDPGGQFGGFATPVDLPDSLLSVPGQGFNRGGKISFMNIKK